MSSALALTADPLLGDELLRLAAAAGVPLAVSSSPTASLSSWTSAPVVLVGSDLLGEVLGLAPSRRPGVHVVAWSPPPDGAYRDALLLGAAGVVELPVGSEWVAEVLTDLGDAGGLPGPLIGVLGGSGGAGATTFACALGQVAARSGPSLVVDLDARGPGCDRVLALDEVPGVRWDSLGQASGRLSARSLRDAVPRLDGPGVLAFAARPSPPEPAAVREALSAARRGHDTVIADLPRSGDALDVLARCDVVVVLVRPTLSGVTAAARSLDALPDRSRAGLVVRGRGADAARVAELVGAPVLAVMPDQRRLAESLDLGLGPVRSHRSPLARAARSVLASLAVPGRLVAA